MRAFQTLIAPLRKQRVGSYRLVSSKGLLDVPETSIRKPSDIKVAAERARTVINMIRHELKARIEFPGSNAVKLRLLDAISNELCLVMDTAEFTRNVHAIDKYRQAADQSFATLGQVITDLNADSSLFELLQQIVTADFALLQEEDRRFAVDMLQEFQSEGVHFDSTSKEQLHHVTASIGQAESQWMKNLSSAPKSHEVLSLGPFNKEHEDSLVLLQQWLEGQGIKQQQNDHLSIPKGDRNLMASILTSLEQRDLRQALWIEQNLHPVKNLSVLRSLLAHRQAKATLLSTEDMHNSSALHRTLLKSSLNTPEQVSRLLLSLAESSRPYARHDLDYLSQHLFKANSSSRSRRSSLLPWDIDLAWNKSNSSQVDRVNSNSSQLQPWDLSYLQNISTPSSHDDDDDWESIRDQIKEFLPLEACLDGLTKAAAGLFGITLHREDGPSLQHTGELWGVTEGVVKFTAVDQEQSLLGTVYLDLFKRPMKFPGAAHFTVRGACHALPFPPLGKSADWLKLLKDVHVDYASKISVLTIQRPVVVLVFPLSLPTVNSAKKVHEDTYGLLHSSSPSLLKSKLLSLGEVETLFHEWGHALHSLLSQTKYQHLSGTRGPTDLVEVPSHLFEHLARDPTALRQWMRHNVTGQPVSLELLQKALRRRESFAAIDLQTQLLLSGADQALSMLTPQAHEDDWMLFARANQLLVEQQRLLTDLPVGLIQPNCDAMQRLRGGIAQSLIKQEMEMSSMHLLAHHHLVGYHGSYYAYLFAKVVAAQVWDNLFGSLQDPLDRKAGEYLRKELLSLGCSRAPQEMLSRLLTLGKDKENKRSLEELVDPKPFLDRLFSNHKAAAAAAATGK